MTDLRCRRCLLRDGSEEDRRMLSQYTAVIHDEDRASDVQINQRLRICRDCDQLYAATCIACGCYVEFRASVKRSCCPKRKWT